MRASKIMNVSSRKAFRHRSSIKMSSPAKKASTGGIRKTTIKNNLYLKNRAALLERGFFILRITSSIKPPLSRGFGCFMNHGFFASRSYHGSRMPKSCKGPPLLPKQEPQRTAVPSIYRLTLHTKKTANTRSLFLYHLFMLSISFLRAKTHFWSFRYAHAM